LLTNSSKNILQNPSEHNFIKKQALSIRLPKILTGSLLSNIFIYFLKLIYFWFFISFYRFLLENYDITGLILFVPPKPIHKPYLSLNYKKLFDNNEI